MSHDNYSSDTGGDSPVTLYLHIPKTGGTTLNKHLYRHLCAKTHDVAEQGYFHSGIYYYPQGFFVKPNSQMPANIRRALARDDLRAVLGHFRFGLHRYLSRPWTYVTLLRDPVDRIISLYCHLNIAHEKSLEEFVSDPPYREFDNDQTRRISGIDAQIGHCTGLMLEKAKDNLGRYFSVVGTMERFDETLILLKRRFGWKKELFYYFKNFNPRRPAKETFAKQTLDAITSRNALDLKLYDFAQTLLDQAVRAQDNGFAEELESYRSMKAAIDRRKKSMRSVRNE